MKISLTTAYNPGDLDQGNTYPHVKIVGIRYDPVAQSVDIICQYGTESGSWSAGVAAIRRHEVLGADYTTLVAMLSNDGEAALVALERVCYQYLLDEGIYAGTLA